jgi:hypothetical protein
MKLKIAKILRPLDLGEKAAEYSGQSIQVWINPSLEFLKERDGFILEYAGKNKLLEEARIKQVQDLEGHVQEFAAWLDGEFTDKNHAWFARLWSQAENADTYWTLAEVNELKRADPALLDWMKSRSIEMIAEYRRAEKKS